MKPIIHAKLSVKKYGGSVDDYLPIHDFIDSSKQCVPDVRHRAILHSSFGCFIAEKVFGHVITNSDGAEISVRDIAEDHIISDLGFLPSMNDYLNCMSLESWMQGSLRNRKSEK